MTTIGVGHAAPGFSLKSLDGNQYSLDSLLARGPVVAAFFKISCPVCQFTFPFLQRIAERFAGKNALVVGISQDDARSTRRFNEEFGVRFLTLLDDAAYAASNAYRLTSVPTIFLIADDRTVQVSSSGFEKAALEKITAELAQFEKMAAAPLFQRSENVPAFKPG